MLKVLTWITLVSVLYISLFNDSVNLTNNLMALALMILLLSLSSDLKEFDFWGLKGKIKEKKLRELEGEQALPDKTVEIDSKKLDEAEKVPASLKLMDDAQGNFLALAFEVERLLRVFATVGLVKDVPSNTNIKSLISELRKADLLTDAGVKQWEGIRWLRNMLVHARHNEINQATLEAGVEIALSFYAELYTNIYGEPPQL
jgi:hypothetical protein